MAKLGEHIPEHRGIAGDHRDAEIRFNLFQHFDRVEHGALKVNRIDGIGAVQPNGSQQVTPADSTTYHLVAKGAGGSQEATARVTVNAAAAPPPPPPGAAPEKHSEAVTGRPMPRRASCQEPPRPRGKTPHNLCP